MKKPVKDTEPVLESSAPPVEDNPKLKKSSLRKLVYDALIFWAASRIALIIIFVAGHLAGKDFFVSNPLVLWDSSWYLQIAGQGYSYQPGSAEFQNIAFFPLLPITIRALGVVIPVQHLPIAASVLSSLLFLGALLLLAFWMSNFLSRAHIRLTLFLISFFPTSLYFSLPYTESLFLCLTLLVFVLCNYRRWGLAAVCCLLSGLARHNGWIVGTGIFLGYLLNQKNKSSSLKCAIVCFAGFLATALFFFYSYIQFGDFFAPVRAHSTWGVKNFFFFPAYYSHLRDFLLIGPSAGMGIVVDGTWALAVFALAILTCYRTELPMAARVYGLLSALYPLVLMGGEGIRSLIRFSSVIFPVWIFLGCIAGKRRLILFLLIFLWIGLWLFLTIRFFQGKWVQ